MTSPNWKMFFQADFVPDPHNPDDEMCDCEGCREALLGEDPELVDNGREPEPRKPLTNQTISFAMDHLVGQRVTTEEINRALQEAMRSGLKYRTHNDNIGEFDWRNVKEDHVHGPECDNGWGHGETDGF